ncbi:MAG: chemotaxis-specific protein-glutamate methyltransferase CheB [Candidatus Hydrothermae bacterium]|nr:chemotaxis-specific protein-glutamate methyltransferase CheB [Candidatus Hydrothermae bacterium]
MKITRPVRVLIVDDSPTVRFIVRKILSRDPSIEVVGEAKGGKEAVELVRKLRPDVMTLDLRMPDLDGLQVTEIVMAEEPTPILILTSAIDRDEKYTTFEAISRGTLDVMEKPGPDNGSDWSDSERTLLEKVKLLSTIRVVPHVRPRIHGNEPIRIKKAVTYEFVAIGASTGGPKLLRTLFESLPPDFSLGIAVVQHITRGFEESFAEWLSRVTPFEAKIARDNDEIQPGKILIAPPGLHLIVKNRERVGLSDAKPLNGQKPSADFLFMSASAVFGERVIGMILSGMGRDGARGLKMLSGAGGKTLALREEECAVFGMPRAAYDEGAVDGFSSLAEIIQNLVKAHENKKRSLK